MKALPLPSLAGTTVTSNLIQIWIHTEQEKKKRNGNVKFNYFVGSYLYGAY